MTSVFLNNFDKAAGIQLSDAGKELTPVFNNESIIQLA